MCGITGIYVLDDRREAVLGTIGQMTDVIRHRGPDEGGVKIFASAALGNRRLKIIDLVTGQQPMTNETGSVWVTFNGEIYNFQTLRPELLDEGHLFNSHSDTEVIVHAFETWGLDAFSRLDGQFAIAIYERNRHRLILARDRLGIKPLYFAVRKGHLIFGSEVKSILAHPLVEAKPNYRAVTSYLSYRYPLGQESWYDGIFMLQPGEMLIAENGRYHLETYWRLPLNPIEKPDLDEVEMVTQVRDLLDRSVRQRMISDVPVGAYLSGGLDSSIVVSLMAQRNSKPVKTFTIGFAEDQFNEFEYARLVADHYSTDHHEIVLQAANYMELLPDLIRYKDAPLSVPNEVPLYVMSQELKKYITVVLSGEGADELFGGYGRIFRSPYDYARMQMLADGSMDLPPDFREALNNNLNKLYGQSVFNTPLDHFLHLYAYTPIHAQWELFTSDFLEMIGGDVGLRRFWEDQFKYTASLTQYEQYKWLFERHHLIGLLLRVDMTTMATAVEARVPFVDHHLIEYVFKNIPFEYMMRWRSPQYKKDALLLNSADISENQDITKYLLRQAFANDLPKEILTRKKVGFPVPLDNWLQGDFGKFAREILLDNRTRDRAILCQDTTEKWLRGEGLGNRRGQIIWMLVNLELWFRMYID